jgi:hypothetical protein
VQDPIERISSHVAGDKMHRERGSSQGQPSQDEIVIRLYNIYECVTTLYTAQQRKLFYFFALGACVLTHSRSRKVKSIIIYSNFSGLVHVIKPNLIKPLLNPRSMRNMAYAPLCVLNPLFARPNTLLKFKLLLMTAFQKGAMI